MRRLPLVAAAAVLLASCSLGDKQDQADRIATSVERAVAAGPVQGTITMAVRPRAIDVPAGFDESDLAIDFDPSAFTPFEATARFEIDDAARSSRLVTADGSFPEVLFDEIGIRLLRTDVAPDDARPWLSVDYADLSTDTGGVEQLDAGSAFGYLAVFDPAMLLDLAAGPLAGSVKAEELASGATRYDVNFDIPKALDDERDEAYDDDRRETVDTLLELMKVSGDVHPGTAVLSPTGDLLRFELALHIRIERFEQADLQITLDLTTADVPAGSPEPTAQQLVLVDTLFPLRNAAAASAPDDPFGGLLDG